MEIGNSKLQIPLPEPTGRLLRPFPRGTVIPRYWGDPSRFGGATKEHWSWKRSKSRCSLPLAPPTFGFTLERGRQEKRICNLHQPPSPLGWLGRMGVTPARRKFQVWVCVYSGGYISEHKIRGIEAYARPPLRPKGGGRARQESCQRRLNLRLPSFPLRRAGRAAILAPAAIPARTTN